MATEAEVWRQRALELEVQLQEAEETLDAIRRGGIDALVVNNGQQHRVYTLESADRPYRVLIEQIQEAAVMLASDGMILYCNRRLAQMLGLPQERVVGRSLRPFLTGSDQDRLDRMLSNGGGREELTIDREDGRIVPVFVSLGALPVEGEAPMLCGVLADLTQQKAHLRELSMTNAQLREEITQRKAAEAALRQSQKMEAVGQLTGGIAHDFNNLLTSITGSLELLEMRIGQGRLKDLDRYVQAAQGAAKRAASLTHRLLAFSRQQTLDPKTTNVNMLVAGMEDLIRRTVGPAIEVEVAGAADLWPTLVDPPQLENALLNLCINARDAMPDGGQIVIQASNRRLDERMAMEEDVPQGEYVSLSVTDTGTGMPPEVIAKAFDPFFTTKPIGQGTGLGLSMIYGFVRQSGGEVRIHSEVGQGTSICLYLPRHQKEAVEDTQAELGPTPRAGAGETVMVVDDEATVRMLVTDVLDELGYTAVEAADGPSGLKILQSDLRVDLLVTDVGLPGGLNGRQLADAARQLRPELRILFITGYAENAAIGKGPLEPGMHVLIKPFSVKSLAAKIRELLVTR